MVKDKAKWIHIFSSSVDSKFNFNKRWDIMPKVTSTTNEVPVYDDFKQSKGNLKKGSKEPSPRKGSIEAVEDAHRKNRKKKS